MKYHLYSGGTSYPILIAKASDKDLGADEMRNLFIIAGCVGAVILFLVIGVPIICCVIKQKKLLILVKYQMRLLLILMQVLKNL